MPVAPKQPPDEGLHPGSIRQQMLRGQYREPFSLIISFDWVKSAAATKEM